MCYGVVICTTNDKNKAEYGDSGGLLISCTDGFKRCKMIGVASVTRESMQGYVSTHTERNFIKKSLKNIVFIQNDAVRESAMSKLLVAGFSFFTVMLILY